MPAAWAAPKEKVTASFVVEPAQPVAGQTVRFGASGALRDLVRDEVIASLGDRSGDALASGNRSVRPRR